MSAFCFIIARDVRAPKMVQKSLLSYCSSYCLRVSFEPVNFARICYFEQLNPKDIVFEPYDMADADDAGILMEFDGVTVNGKASDAPLQQRLKKIQNLMLLCLKNASRVELYLTSQMPGFDEYEELHLPGEQVAQGLWRRYQAVPSWCPFVPDVHLVVLE